MATLENHLEEVVVDVTDLDEENHSDSNGSTINCSDSSIEIRTRRLASLDKPQIIDILKEELKNQLNLEGSSSSGPMNQSCFCKLFSNEDVVKMVFHLFDVQSDGKISPSFLITEILNSEIGRNKVGNGCEVTKLFDTLIIVLANESKLDSELFQRIFTINAVQQTLYTLIDSKSSDGVTVDAIIAFLRDISMPKRVTWNEEHLKNADMVFETHKKEGTDNLTFDDFKKMIPCKNPFFAERAFQIFDKERKNSVSRDDYRETLQQFSNQSVDDKVRFIFQIYDQDGDGVIKLEELKSALIVCSEESGMKFTDEQLNQLTLTLFEDAKQCGDGDRKKIDPDDGVGFEELKAQMARQPGLLENLSTSLEQFLVPTAVSKKKKKPENDRISSSIFSLKYLKNNVSIVSFVIGFLLINLILFVVRAIQVYQNTSSILYMFARASGECLNFDCAFVVVLMLRHCITWLRMRGLATILPLDHHVYLHKLCGIMIVFHSLLHTVMHLINFPMNVADKKISNVTYHTHSTVEWLFTAIPGEFGLVGGCATLTGWVLLLILFIMVVFALPIVRNRGGFELFYWTHLLYIPFWINLILHGPYFWNWFVGPGVLFVFFEKILKSIYRWTSQGHSQISSAVLFPSRVTHLVIKKPSNFHYHPGDYINIQIPALARFEWHPFTISSAPELPDYLWLHIRCAGGWTCKLYEFFELKMAQVSWRQRIAQKKPSSIITLTSDLSVSQQSVAEKASDHTGKIILGESSLSTVENSSPSTTSVTCRNVNNRSETIELNKAVKINIDGPYGAPSSPIFRAQHAVLIAAGIGVTPYASILQSIMNRYSDSRQTCPSCQHTWAAQMPDSITNLKKVDFFWINRDPESICWFFSLLSQLEMEQPDMPGGTMDRFLDFHMYITSALKKNDMKAVCLQTALDLYYAKEQRDLVTGLKTRSNAGRPNWDQVFKKIRDEKKGKVTVFYCGPPQLAKELKGKCDAFGFNFRKEIF